MSGYLIQSSTLSFFLFSFILFNFSSFFPIIPFSLSLFLLFPCVSSFPFPLPKHRFGYTFSTARPWSTWWIITTFFPTILFSCPMTPTTATCKTQSRPFNYELVTVASSMWGSEKEKVVVQGGITAVVSLTVVGNKMNEKN